MIALRKPGSILCLLHVLLPFDKETKKEEKFTTDFGEFGLVFAAFFF